MKQNILNERKIISMSKLQLPSVTLMCIDCVDARRARLVLDHCKSFADFGDVKMLTSREVEYQHRQEIVQLNSLIAYSVFMLTRLHEYIETDHVLIVQRDGWILNPGSFDPAWLNLDYIGPLFMQYDKVGSGGFSLRSRRLMQYMASVMPDWDGTQSHAERIQKTLNYYEDGVISIGSHSGRFKIGSKEQAANFAQGGNRNPEYFRSTPFGFHRTWQEIDFKTGIVNSSDTSKDIHVSYDYEIDTL